MTSYRAFQLDNDRSRGTCCLHLGPFMSENRSFGSQAVRPKVGTSANSALIRYYLPRLKLSIALFSRKRGNERLVTIHLTTIIRDTK